MRVWNIDSNREVRAFGRVGGSVTSVAFLPDGRRMLAGTDDGGLRLWDSGNGDLLAELKGHTKIVTGVALLPGGRRAVSCSSDSTLRLWDLEEKRELCRAQGRHQGIIYAVAVSPDGQHAITSGADAKVILWRLPDLP